MIIGTESLKITYDLGWEPGNKILKSIDIV